MPRFRKFSHFDPDRSNVPFAHWYRDNSVYFITARCRDRFAAFESKAAKLVFWDRFDFWTSEFEFVPFVTTLMNNHYHSQGYMRDDQSSG